LKLYKIFNQFNLRQSFILGQIWGEILGYVETFSVRRGAGYRRYLRRTKICTFVRYNFFFFFFFFILNRTLVTKSFFGKNPISNELYIIKYNNERVCYMKRTPKLKLKNIILLINIYYIKL